jgi:hypothetical protein
MTGLGAAIYAFDSIGIFKARMPGSSPGMTAG